MSSTLYRLLAFQKRAAFVMTTVLALSGLLFAQSTLTDDTQTSNKARTADTNYGANTSLTVSSTSNAYIKFKLSSTLPAGTRGADVARATIKLYINSVSAPGKIDIYQVNDAWNESALTFNSSPALGNLLATTAQIENDKKGSFIVIDVTPAVQQWLGDDGQGTNGAPNYGLVLIPHPIDATTPSLANITFDSKENVQTSHEPELHIALTRSGGLATITHDGTLSGDGTSASPLGIRSQSVGTPQLADGSVTNIKLSDLIITSQKIVDGAVTNTKLSDVSVTTQKIANDAVTNLKLAPGSVTTDKIADGALNAQKIAPGQVLKSVNGLSDNITLQAGANITITPSGNTLTIAGSEGGLPRVSHNATLAGDGTAGSPLSVVVPLTLMGSTPNPTLFVGNGGGGSAIFAQGSVDTNSHYSIGGTRILSASGFGNTFLGGGSGQNNTAGTMNSFFGEFAGQSNTQGQANSFFGKNAGSSNTSGSSNSFMGQEAGFSNTTGESNSFFGRRAGQANTSGGLNSFFGHGAGIATTTGGDNSFFGSFSGAGNTLGAYNSFFGVGAGAGNATGVANSFFGYTAGSSNTTGGGNTFLGSSAGRSNTTESNNTFVGHLSNGAPGITNATALGYGATVQQSNAVVLGNEADVGIGITMPKARLHVAGGRIYVETNGQGLILKSPNGAVCIEITASNIGSLQYGPIACPQ